MSVAEVHERKLNARNVAMVLGIICIVLGVSLVGAILSFQNQVNDLTNTLNLSKSLTYVSNQTVIQGPSGFYSCVISGISYVGYLSVDVQFSTTNTTYVQVISTDYAVRTGIPQIKYDNQTEIGTGGTVNFPIFPSDVVEVRVGNSDLINGARETISITYYY